MKSCETCGLRGIEDKDYSKAVPYIVYEGAQVRNDRIVKRLVIALVVAVLLMFASNGLWLAFVEQYDFSSFTVDVQSDSNGNANYIGNDGDIYNGTSEGSD